MMVLEGGVGWGGGEGAPLTKRCFQWLLCGQLERVGLTNLASCGSDLIP